MGWINFVRDAGDRLAGVAKDLLGTGGRDDAQAAQQIIEKIKSLELAISDVGVEFSGDAVSIRGIASSQADRERAVLVAGNIEGVARVNDQIMVVAPAEGKPADPPARFYTVVTGDTLSKIAKAEYGDAMKYPLIFEANRPMLANPDKIYPGQVLRIPSLQDSGV